MESLCLWIMFCARFSNKRMGLSWSSWLSGGSSKVASEEPNNYGSPVDPRNVYGLSPGTLVFVYASWCGYCKAARPVMASVASLGVPVRSIEVSGPLGITHAKMLQDQGIHIKSVPKIYVLTHKRSLLEYEGPMTVESLSRFAKQQDKSA